MNTKICTSFKACPVSDVLSITKYSIILKDGKSFISLFAIKPTTFTIKSYDTPAGYRNDFTMSVFLKAEEAKLLEKHKRSLVLLLSISDGSTLVVGSTNFPVKASLSSDINVSTVEFTQSAPG